MTPAPSGALFPPRSSRALADAALSRALFAAEASVRAGPVTPTFDRDAFERELASFTFEAEQPLEQTLAWTVAQLQDGVVHVNHPRYFGL
ncbi:MAG: hypothetical protein JO326_02255, partial [Acetobacteraceae bacterium]|nr:hypothetical protein [Acetobacteraceae bacterium]